MLVQSTTTLTSPLSEIGMLGVLIIGALTGWGLFKEMFANKEDFLESVTYLFTSGWISTKRGDLRKNAGGTFRFLTWLWLTIVLTIVGGMLLVFLLSAIAG